VLDDAKKGSLAMVVPLTLLLIKTKSKYFGLDGTELADFSLGLVLPQGRLFVLP